MYNSIKQIQMRKVELNKKFTVAPAKIPVIVTTSRAMK
jgi:hypothetical protein